MSSVIPFTERIENLVGDLERLFDGQFADGVEQAVVRDDDDRVAHVAEAFQSGLGVGAPDLTLRRERRRDDGDGERAGLAGRLGDHGGASGAGAAAESGGDEHHVRALNRVVNLLLTFEGGLLADLRERPRTAAARLLFSHQNLRIRLDLDEVLNVRVRGDQRRPVNSLFGHSIDRVSTATATPDDGDVGLEFLEYVLQFLVGHRPRKAGVLRGTSDF